MADGLADGLADGALKHGIGLRNNAAVRRFAAWPPHAFDRQFYPVDSTPRAGGSPLPHATRLQAGKDTCSRCRPLAAGRSFHAGPRRGLARLPYLGGVAALRGFSSLRYLTLAIGDRRAVRHGMGGRVPGRSATPRHLLLGKRSHTLLGHWHCHSVVNVRSGTLRGEWQCSAHCHPASSVPKRYDQGRVAVRPVRSGASGSTSHTATRR